jgi:hypothetical protein
VLSGLFYPPLFGGRPDRKKISSRTGFEVSSRCQEVMPLYGIPYSGTPDTTGINTLDSSADWVNSWRKNLRL